MFLWKDVLFGRVHNDFPTTCTTLSIYIRLKKIIQRGDTSKNENRINNRNESKEENNKKKYNTNTNTTNIKFCSVWGFYHLFFFCVFWFRRIKKRTNIGKCFHRKERKGFSRQNFNSWKKKKHDKSVSEFSNCVFSHKNLFF